MDDELIVDTEVSTKNVHWHKNGRGIRQHHHRARPVGIVKPSGQRYAGKFLSTAHPRLELISKSEFSEYKQLAIHY